MGKSSHRIGSAQSLEVRFISRKFHIDQPFCVPTVHLRHKILIFFRRINTEHLSVLIIPPGAHTRRQIIGGQKITEQPAGKINAAQRNLILDSIAVRILILKRGQNLIPVLNGLRLLQSKRIQPILAYKKCIGNHHVVHILWRVRNGIDMSVRCSQQIFQFRVFIQNLLDIRRILTDQIIQRLDQSLLRQIIYSSIGHGRRHYKNIRQIASRRNSRLHDRIVIRACLPVDFHACPVLNFLPDFQVVVDGYRRVPALQTGHRQVIRFPVPDRKRVSVSGCRSRAARFTFRCALRRTVCRFRHSRLL